MLTICKHAIIACRKDGFTVKFYHTFPVGLTGYAAIQLRSYPYTALVQIMTASNAIECAAICNALFQESSR